MDTSRTPRTALPPALLARITGRRGAAEALTSRTHRGGTAADTDDNRPSVALLRVADGVGYEPLAYPKPSSPRERKEKMIDLAPVDASTEASDLAAKYMPVELDLPEHFSLLKAKQDQLKQQRQPGEKMKASDHLLRVITRMTQQPTFLVHVKKGESRTTGEEVEEEEEIEEEQVDEVKEEEKQQQDQDEIVEDLLTAALAKASHTSPNNESDDVKVPLSFPAVSSHSRHSSILSHPTQPHPHPPIKAPITAALSRDIISLQSLAQWCVWMRCDMYEKLPATAVPHTDVLASSCGGYRTDALQITGGVNEGKESRLHMVLRSLFSTSDHIRSLGILCLCVTNTRASATIRSTKRIGKNAVLQQPDGVAYALLIREFVFPMLHDLCRSSEVRVRNNMALALHLLLLHPANIRCGILHSYSLSFLTHCLYLAQHARERKNCMNALSAATKLSQEWRRHLGEVEKRHMMDGAGGGAGMENQHPPSHHHRSYSHPYHHTSALNSSPIPPPPSLHSPLFLPPPPDTVLDTTSTEFVTGLNQLCERVTEVAVMGSEASVAAAIEASKQEVKRGVEEGEMNEDGEGEEEKREDEEDTDPNNTTSDSNTSSKSSPVILLPPSATSFLLLCMLGPSQSSIPLQKLTKHLEPQRTCVIAAEQGLYTRMTELAVQREWRKMEAAANGGAAIQNPAPRDTSLSDDPTTSSSQVHTPSSALRLSLPHRISFLALSLLCNLSAMPQHQPVLLENKKLVPTLVKMCEWSVRDLSGMKTGQKKTSKSSNTSIAALTSTFTPPRPYSYVTRLLLQTLANLSYSRLSHAMILHAVTTSSSASGSSSSSSSSSHHHHHHHRLGATLLSYTLSGSYGFYLPPEVYPHWIATPSNTQGYDHLNNNPYTYHPHTTAADFLIPPFGLDLQPDPRIYSKLATEIISNVVGMMRGEEEVERVMRGLCCVGGGEEEEEERKKEKRRMKRMEKKLKEKSESEKKKQSKSKDMPDEKQLLELSQSSPSPVLGCDTFISCLSLASTKLDSSSARLALMSLVRLTNRSEYTSASNIILLKSTPSRELLESLMLMMDHLLQDVRHYATIVLTNIVVSMHQGDDEASTAQSQSQPSDSSPIHLSITKLLTSYLSLLRQDDISMKILSLTALSKLFDLDSTRVVLCKLPQNGEGAMLEIVHLLDLNKVSLHTNINLQFSALSTLLTFITHAEKEGGLILCMMRRLLPQMLSSFLALSQQQDNLSLAQHSVRVLLKCFQIKRPDVRALLALGGQEVLEVLVRLVSNGTTSATNSTSSSSISDLPLTLCALTLLRHICAITVWQPAVVRLGVPDLLARWMLDGGGGGNSTVNKNSFSSSSDFLALKRAALSTQIKAQQRQERYDKLLIASSLQQLRMKMWKEWCGSLNTQTGEHDPPSIQMDTRLEIALLLRSICVSVAPAIGITMKQQREAAENAAAAKSTTATLAATQAIKAKNATMRQKMQQKKKGATAVTGIRSKKKPSSTSGVTATRGSGNRFGTNMKSKTSKPSTPLLRKASKTSTPSTASKPPPPQMRASPVAYEVFRSLLDTRVLDVLVKFVGDAAPAEIELKRTAASAMQALLPFALTQFRTGLHHLPTRRMLIICFTSLLNLSSTSASVSSPEHITWILDSLLILFSSHNNTSILQQWLRTQDGVALTMKHFRVNVTQAKEDDVQLAVTRMMNLVWKNGGVSSGSGMAGSASTAAPSSEPQPFTFDSSQISLILSLATTKIVKGGPIRLTRLKLLNLQLLSHLTTGGAPQQLGYHSQLYTLDAVSLLLPLYKHTNIKIKHLGMVVLCALLQSRDEWLIEQHEKHDLLDMLLHLAALNPSTAEKEVKVSKLTGLPLPMPPMTAAASAAAAVAAATIMRIKSSAANCVVRLAKHADQHQRMKQLQLDGAVVAELGSVSILRAANPLSPPTKLPFSLQPPSAIPEEPILTGLLSARKLPPMTAVVASLATSVPRLYNDSLLSKMLPSPTASPAVPSVSTLGGASSRVAEALYPDDFVVSHRSQTDARKDGGATSRGQPPLVSSREPYANEQFDDYQRTAR